MVVKLANEPNPKGQKSASTCEAASGGQTRPLTPRLLSVLDFVAGYIARNRCAPTYQEIGAALGMSAVATVAKHVNRLIDAGMLSKSERRRSLQLTAAARKIARVEEGAA